MRLTPDVSFLHLVDQASSLYEFGLLLALPVESKLPVDKPRLLLDHVDLAHHHALLGPDPNELVISASHEAKWVLANRSDCIYLASMSSINAFDLNTSAGIKKAWKFLHFSDVEEGMSDTTCLSFHSAFRHEANFLFWVWSSNVNVWHSTRC